MRASALINNNLKIEMKKIIAFLLIVLTVVSGFALERYASRMTPDGTIYFIMSKTLSKLQGIKHFEYDMTLLSWTDSVTVNFTFQSKIMGLPTELYIKSGDQSYRCADYSLLFQDLKKNSFEIRVTSKFLTEDLEKIIHSDNPPMFVFPQGDQEASAAYSESAWKKDRKKLIDIYNIYLYSKSKKL